MDTIQLAVGRVVTTYIRTDVPDTTSISIGIPCPAANWFVVQKLSRCIPCGCAELAAGSEPTCLAYAVYDTIKYELIGSTPSQLKSGVSSVACAYRNGEFTIHIMCGEWSSVKRVLECVSLCMTPAKLYPRYSANVRLINFKPIRAEFVYVYNQLITDLIMNVVIVSKHTFPEDGMHELIGRVDRNLPFEKTKGQSIRPDSMSKRRGVTSYITVPAKSFDAMFAVEYLATVDNTNTVVWNDHIIHYGDNTTTQGLSSRGPKARIKLPKNKAAIQRIDQYVQSYAGTTTGMLMYAAASIHHLNICSLLNILKSNLRPDELEERIRKIISSIYTSQHD